MILLIADDRKDIVQGIAHAIDWEAKNVRVLCAYNGLEALKLIEKEKVDLVITDICMPQMDGLEMVRLARELRPDVRFAILTGFEDFSYAREAIHLGVIEYLTKPVQLEVIEKLVADTQKTLREEEIRRQEEKKRMQQLFVGLPILRSRCFQELLCEKMPDRETLQQKFDEYDISLTTGSVTVVLVELDHYYELANQDSVRAVQSYGFAVCNIWKELLGEGYTCEDFRCANNRIALVHNHAPGKNRLVVQYELYEKATKLQSYIRQFFDITISVGIGDTYQDMQNLQKSYRDAENALSHKLYYGDGCTMSTVNLEDKFQQIKDYPEDVEEELLRCVKHGAVEQADEKIRQLFDILCGMRTEDPNAIKELVLRLLLRLLYECSYCQDARILDTLNEYRKFGTLDEISGFMGELIHRLAQETSEISNDTRSNVLKVKKYIDEHYAETITLKKMSEYIYISQPYLSCMFKEVVGQNFNEYLTFVRMEHAKELLLQEGSRVYEICEQVGYRDKKHFTNLFKKCTGQLPKEWALQNQSDK